MRVCGCGHRNWWQVDRRGGGFTTQLAFAKAREVPTFMHWPTVFAWQRWWTRMLHTVCARSFAASLVERPGAGLRVRLRAWRSCSAMIRGRWSDNFACEGPHFPLSSVKKKSQQCACVMDDCHECALRVSLDDHCGMSDASCECCQTATGEWISVTFLFRSDGNHLFVHCFYGYQNCDHWRFFFVSSSRSG